MMREIKGKELAQVVGGLKWEGQRESTNVVDCRNSQGGVSILAMAKWWRVVTTILSTRMTDLFSINRFVGFGLEIF